MALAVWPRSNLLLLPKAASAEEHSNRCAGTSTAPFIMAPFNTRIVRRSNALQGWAYGRSLQYGEVMGVARGPAGAVIARAMALGLRAFTGAMAFPPTREVLDPLLPA